MKDPEIWTLHTRRIGRRVLSYHQVESTNSLAMQLAGDAANDGTVILAGEQTAGRGRYGRSWHCPPGTGVLLSCVVFPPEHVRTTVLLTAWAAVAVCSTIHRLASLLAQIKWPNDVLVDGRKVCGILIEQGAATVVGIGLNVNQTSGGFAAAGLDHATSLALRAGQAMEVRQVARTLIEELDHTYDQMCRGELELLQARWQASLGVVGREAMIECHDETYAGRLLSLSWNALEIELPGSGVVRVRPESVKHINALAEGA